MNLEAHIKTLNHSLEKRNHFANYILDHPELLPELLAICKKVDEEISCKASWGLEFLCKHKIYVILPYIDKLLTIAKNVHQHPAVRPIAKIMEYLCIEYYKQEDPKIQTYLTTNHREKITEICFDWLITDQKVAPKAYAIICLHLLGTEFSWVHPELKVTLEKNYNASSAAYKARARMVLSKIG